MKKLKRIKEVLTDEEIKAFKKYKKAIKNKKKALQKIYKS